MRSWPTRTRAPHVDVIDIRYWAYTADDGLYAPEGGQNLAPRQHLRQTRQKPGGFAAIVKAVREYRTRYPDKAVTYYADMNCPSGRDGWAVLMGGGSLPNVKLPEELADDHSHACGRPTASSPANKRWCLADADGDYLIYTDDDRREHRSRRLPNESARYRVHWIDAEYRRNRKPAKMSPPGAACRLPAEDERALARTHATTK